MTTKTEDTGLARVQNSTRPRGRAWAALLLGVCFQLGCNGAAGSGANAPGGAITRRDTAVTHEACDTSGSGTEKIEIVSAWVNRGVLLFVLTKYLAP